MAKAKKRPKIQMSIFAREMIQPGMSLSEGYEQSEKAKALVEGTKKAASSKTFNRKMRELLSSVGAGEVTQRQVTDFMGRIVRNELFRSARRMALNNDLLAGGDNRRMERDYLTEQKREEMANHPELYMEEFSRHAEGMRNTFQEMGKCEAISSLAEWPILSKIYKTNIEQLTFLNDSLIAASVAMRRTRRQAV